MAKQKVAIFGATGSIGTSSLDVLKRHPDLYQVYVLSAFSQIKKLAGLCAEFKPKMVVVPSPNALIELQNLLGNLASKITILIGDQGFESAVVEADIIIAAITGSAGLPSTLSAAKLGKKILLANKESLVMAGDLLLQTAKQNNAQIIPIDSEHNAIFQCLPHNYQNAAVSGISRIVLTASGGPFWAKKDLTNITVSEACTHPNWSMGRKISVDSSTMMNKGLELIEACYLFNLDLKQIKVVVHPQSIVHSWVEYIDGAVLAELSNPDMRISIAQALAYPKRITSGVSSLDLSKMNAMQFLEPDNKRFPSLNLARDALQIGNCAPIYLNASNEVAVSAFLESKISFMQITQVVAEALHNVPSFQVNDLENIMYVDKLARIKAQEIVGRMIK